MVSHKAWIWFPGKMCRAVSRGCRCLVFWYAVYQGDHDGVYQEGAICEEGGRRGRWKRGYGEGKTAALAISGHDWLMPSWIVQTQLTTLNGNWMANSHRGSHLE